MAGAGFGGGGVSDALAVYRQLREETEVLVKKQRKKGDEYKFIDGKGM